MSANPFYYHLVGQPLIDELRDQVGRGNSLVLLAPRFGGKRHVVRRLGALLERDYPDRIVETRLLSDTPLSTAEDLKEVIREAVERVAPDLQLSLDNPDDLVEPLELLSDYSRQPVIFFATNVDGMGHHLARRFLQGIRTLVEGKKLIAVLTGEDDFQKLVHGENSEFACAVQFVLQGYDQKEFYEFVDDYLRYVRLELAPRDEVFEHIWHLTGGNIYQLRMVLWTLIQTRSRNNIEPAKPVTIADLPGEVKLAGIPGVYGAYVFRHAAQIIETDAECWKTLERLIEDETVDIGISTVPTTLELAGVAIRRQEERRLVPASKLMLTFAKEYYDARRFGDLYAVKGNWEKAFSYYQTLDAQERMRPLGTDDKRATENIMNALGATLHSKATKIAEHGSASEVAFTLQELFAQGCYYLLGFREISFWTRSSRDPRKWKYRELNNLISSMPQLSISSNSQKKIQASLPSKSHLPFGVFPLQGDANKLALATHLPSGEHGEQLVGIVSDFEGGITIDREPERNKRIRSLMDTFTNSYTHAVFITQQQTRERIRRVHRDIFNRILGEIFNWRLDVNRLLDLAAEELRELHYKRVVFSLVDPEKLRIVGISEAVDPEIIKVRIKDEIDWRLDDPSSDLQSFVVNKKEYERVPNAATSELVDKKMAARASIQALGVLPLLNYERTAIGTLLVERYDDTTPSVAEMEDLQDFCGQIAIAIEHAKRVKVVEACLNGIPEPLFIFNKDANPEYGNNAAGELSNSVTGWGRIKPPPNVLKFADQSLRLGHRLARELDVSTEAAMIPRYGVAVADVIKDWRSEPVGALIRIQDQTYLHQYFAAERLVNKGGDPDTAISNILEAMMQIGHKWARLYRLKKDQDDSERFVSELSRGYAEEQFEKEFNDHKVKLFAPDVSPYDWLCMEGNPVVFCWNKDIAKGETYYTPFGLQAINWPYPEQPPQIRKKEGDFWVDFPLISDGERLGKICLECSERFQPEHLLLLKNLSSSFATILDASIRRHRQFQEEELTIKVGTAIKAIGTVAHTLGTRHGSFPFLIRRYRNREHNCPELKSLNDELQDIAKHVSDTVSRAKGFFRAVGVNLKPTNLVDQIRHSLAYAIKDGFLIVDCDGASEQFVIPLDSHLLSMAFNELVRNSREAIEDEHNLKITIKVGASLPGENYVTVDYEDNGPGIPAQFLSRVFDMEDAFSRRPYRQTRGTGLAMNFINRTVKDHGGTIEYVGEPGAGARFLIKLPSGES